MRRVLFVLTFVLFTATAFSFTLMNGDQEFSGIFMEFENEDALPEIVTDSLDRYLEVKIYRLTPDDLKNAGILKDIELSDEPLYSFGADSVNGGGRYKISMDALAGLTYVIIESDNMSAKFISNFRRVEARLLLEESDARLRLWERETGSFISDFEVYRIKDGVLIGKSDEVGEFNFDKLPTNDRTLLIYSDLGSLLWKPDLNKGEVPSKYFPVVVTDRPAYKAGDTVNFRAFIRKISPTGYIIPELGEINVEIIDPLNRKVFDETLLPDKLASVNSSFETNPQVTRGSYKIRLEWENETYYHYFQIADYKKPTFFTRLDGKKVFSAEDGVSITVDSKYYFGDPVSMGNITYTIYSDGMYIDSGAAILDDKGHGVIGYSKEVIPGNYSMTVTVADETGMESSNKINFKIIRGNYEFIPTFQWDNRTINAEVKTVDTEGNGLSNNFEAKIWYEEKFTVYEDDEWKEKKLKIIVLNRNLTSSSDGEADFKLDLTSVPQDKVLFVRFSGDPSVGETAVYERRLYQPVRETYIETFRFIESRPSIPGEKADVLFHASEKMDLWIVSDFSGEIISRAFTTRAGLNTFSIEIPESYPFGEFSLYINGIKNEVRINELFTIPVIQEDKDYSITIESDERYYPGSEVNLRIKVKDDKQKPVEAALTVSVVSRALLDLYEGNRDSWKQAVTAPFMHGFTTVSFVDLNYNPYPSIADLIKEDTFSIAMAESKVLATMAEAGSVEFDFITSDVKARQLFSDQALWEISSFTDENGEASLSFYLPEDLDSWAVRVLTADTTGDFGYEKDNFETWKPLTVSSFLPEFLIAGDSTRFIFSVRNNSSEDAEISGGFYINDEPVSEDSIDIRAFGSETFAYSYDIPDLDPKNRDTKLTVKFVVKSEDDSDGVEYEIPIKPAYVYEKKGEFAFVKGEKDFNYPDGTIAKLNIGSSIKPLLLESIEHLVDYPYGCVEQTMSRWLPGVAASGVVELADEDFREKVSEVIEKGLLRLYGYQHYDGGWGWWKDDNTDAFMTSYVMYGFYIGLENGIEINEDVLYMGYSSLKQIMRWDANPFTQYVLAIYSKYFDEEMTSYTSYEDDAISIILSALTEKILYDDIDAFRTLETIWTFIDLESEDPVDGDSFNYFFDDSVTLALLLEAADKFELPVETVSSIARRLLEFNVGGYWSRTISTSFSVYTLSRIDSNLSENSNIKVSLGNEIVYGGSVKDFQNISVILKEPLKVESTGTVYVSISGEYPRSFSSLEEMEDGIEINRVLRRKYQVPAGDFYVSATPDINAPFIVGSIERLDISSLESVEVFPTSKYGDYEISFRNGELTMDDYRLGIMISRAQLIGKVEDRYLIRTNYDGWKGSGSLNFYLISFEKQTPLEAGNTVISDVHMTISDGGSYIVLEDMLPATGIHVDYEPDYYGKFYSGPYFSTYYTFSEDRYDRSAYFYRYSGNYRTRTVWRIMAPGTYYVPPIVAWGMYSDNYQAIGVGEVIEVK